MRKLKLEYNDRTIFAKCETCCRVDEHGTMLNMFSSAYTKSEWKKGPQCPNCKGSMTKIYEVT